MSQACAVHEVIFDASGKAVDYRYLDFNPAFEHISGLNRDDAIGKLASQLIPDLEPFWVDLFGRVASTGQPIQLDRYTQAFNRYFRVQAYSPAPNQVIAIFLDVTEFKQAEQQLNEVAEKYFTLFNNTSDGMWIHNLEGEILEVNDAYCQMSGYARDELLHMPVSMLEVVENPTEISAHIQKVISQEGHDHFESQHRRKDGTIFDVDITAQYFDLEGGRIAIVIRDITERKKWGAALQESSQRLNRAEEIAHLGSWELDLSSNQLTWSDEVYRIFGYSPGEYTPSYEAFLDAIHPDDRQAVDDAYQSSIREGRDSYEIDHRLVNHTTGEVRVVHEKCININDDHGNIIRSAGMIQDITDRKKDEERLWYLASFAENNPRPIIEIDLEGRISYINPVAKALFPTLVDQGLAHEYLVGYKYLVSPFKKNISKVIVRDLQVGDRYYNQSFSFFPLNKMVRIYGLDITERKQAEQILQQSHNELERRVQERTLELKEANALLRKEIYERQKTQASLEESFQELQVIEEELRNNNEMLIEAQKGLEEERQRYHDLFEFAPDVYLVTDPNGEILSANQVATQLLQVAPQKLVGKPLILFIDPSDAREFRHLLAELKVEKKGQLPELKILPRYGDPVIVAVTVSAANDQTGGETLRWAMRDITAQKQAQELIHQNSIRNAVLSEVSQSLAEASLDEKAILEIVVKTTARLVGDSCVITLASDAGQSLTPAAWYHPKPYALGLINRGKLSDRRRVVDDPVSMAYQNSEPVLIPNMPASPYIDSFRAIYGEYIERIGISSLLVVPIMIGNKTIGTLGLTRDKDGQPYTEDDVSLLEILADRTGQALHNARLYQELQEALIKDLEMQEQLVQSEKFAAVGRLLASITHEINNPLQTIKNCLYLIEQETTSSSPLYEYLSMASRETDRLSNLVAQLREIYRPPTKGQTKLVNLPNVIDEVHTLLAGYLQEKHVSWTVKPADTTKFKSIAVEAVSDQLKQVFLNIALNASDAMEPEGGSLTITLSESLDGTQVGVCFKDTGPGLPDEVKAKLFEPFVTTKEKGLGLGLVICYDIIQKHGGRIEVESEPGEGAAFTIWLPVRKQ